MITADRLYTYIDEIAPFETQMGFDNAGFLVGNPSAQSDTVLVTLDVTHAVLAEAERVGAKIIVSHHPIIFNALKSVSADSVVYHAVQSGVAVISAHTNLDVAEGGVNDSLAEACGVIGDERFAEHCALLGHLAKPMNAVTFAKDIQNRLGLNGLRYSDHGKPIEKVMVSCGAGGENIFLAAQLGADALITGEIKHHEILFASEHRIAVFDLGHYGSENLISAKLAQQLSQQFPDTAFIPSSVFSDQMNYLS